MLVAVCVSVSVGTCVAVAVSVGTCVAVAVSVGTRVGVIVLVGFPDVTISQARVPPSFNSFQQPIRAAFSAIAGITFRDSIDSHSVNVDMTLSR